MNQSYKIYSLGDAAACIDLGNTIDEEINKKVTAIKDWISDNLTEDIKEVFVAFSSVSVYYDPNLISRKNLSNTTAFEYIRQKLETAFHQSTYNNDDVNKKIIRIPVCYSNEFGTDIDFLSHEKNISKEEIIQLHISKIYRVYMIGFLPGFSYLGKLDEKLAIGRKPKPVTVAAGSVGVAGMQTGIYPLVCPGGWQIIGRTPLKLFDPNGIVPVAITVGDSVQFYEISREEFENSAETNRSKIEE